MSFSVLYSQNLIVIVDFFISRLFLLITYKQTNKQMLDANNGVLNLQSKKVMPTLERQQKKKSRVQFLDFKLRFSSILYGTE